MHERLKHLIISSERFKEKKRLSTMLELRHNKLEEGREQENTLRESDFGGLVKREKEKGSVRITTR